MSIYWGALSPCTGNVVSFSALAPLQVFFLCFGCWLSMSPTSIGTSLYPREYFRGTHSTHLAFESGWLSSSAFRVMKFFLRHWKWMGCVSCVSLWCLRWMSQFWGLRKTGYQVCWNFYLPDWNRQCLILLRKALSAALVWQLWCIRSGSTNSIAQCYKPLQTNTFLSYMFMLIVDNKSKICFHKISPH